MLMTQPPPVQDMGCGQKAAAHNSHERFSLMSGPATNPGDQSG
jgi:hypothetical protein